MPEPRLAATFVLILVAACAVLLTMGTLLADFSAADGGKWRALVTALTGAGAGLGMIALLHLSAAAVLQSAQARRAARVRGWIVAWSEVAAGGVIPAVPRRDRAVAVEAAAAVLQEIAGADADLIRSALWDSGALNDDVRAADAPRRPGRGTAALERLALVAAPDTLPLFRSAVRSPVRRAAHAGLIGACRVLAVQGRAEVGPAVIASLREYADSPGGEGGTRALLAAAFLTSGAELAWLCESVLLGEASETLKAAAADALARAQPLEAAAALGQALRSGLMGEAQSAALKALGALGYVPEDTLGAVLAATTSEAYGVRVQACHALVGARPAAALPALWSLLGDEAYEVRFAAAAALARLGSLGAEMLRAAASSHPDAFSRDMASVALSAREEGRRSAFGTPARASAVGA